MQDEMDALINGDKDFKERTADEIAGNIIFSVFYTVKLMVCKLVMEKQSSSFQTSSHKFKRRNKRLPN